MHPFVVGLTVTAAGLALPVAAHAARGPRPTATTDGTAVVVRWTPGAGARATVVERRAGRGAWRRVVRTAGSRTTMRRLVPGRRYAVRLRSVRGGTAGSPGPAIRVRPAPAAPATITARRAGGTVTLTWPAVRRAAGYVLERRDAATDAVVRVPTSGTRTTATDATSGALAGHRLHYVVRAVAGGVRSATGPTAADRVPGLARYRSFFALGDSYSTGVNVGEPADASPCGRTTGAWSRLVPDAFAAAPTSFACNGATTVGVRLTEMGGGTQVASEGGSQLDLLRARIAAAPGPTLVSITIGGNDSEILVALSRCMSGDCLPEADSVSNRIATVVRSRVDETLRQLRAVAPDADIVLAGYPELLTPTGGLTDRVTRSGVTDAERQLVNRWTAELDAQLDAAARQAGVVSGIAATRGGFAGHAIGSADPWLVDIPDVDTSVVTTQLANPLFPFAVTSPVAFHPNAAGVAAQEGAVVAALRDQTR